MIAELYLVCMACKRIPEWTRVKAGQGGKNYEFDGLCPFCNGDKFEVIEARSKTNDQVSD